MSLEGLTQRAGRAWQDHRALVIAAVAAIVVIVTMTALWLTNYSAGRAWKDRAQELERELTDAEERSADRFERLGDALAKVSALENRVQAYEDREGDVEELAAQVEERAAELEGMEAAVAAREAAVAATEEQIAATTITTGVWTVGTDIEPGTYRTAEAVTGSCYWAIYRSGTNQDDIIQNDIVQGGYPTVTLSEGQDFESSRCGSWVRQ
jgi:hypothetical protein